MRDGNIKEVLKYWTAERFKSLQRKLTTAKNTILKDALSRELEPFYSQEEIETLTRAAGILGSVKRKVEHAKEVSAREEKEFERHLQHCKSLRLSLLNQFFPKPDDDQSELEAVILNLALDLNGASISNNYYREHKFFVSALDRVLKKERGLSAKAFAMQCWRENQQWLEENLWPYDQEPNKEIIERLVGDYQSVWRDEVLNHPSFSSEVARFQTVQAITNAPNVTRL